nr:MAG TPA: hypothetical protein [Inoviridae sp.]
MFVGLSHIKSFHVSLVFCPHPSGWLELSEGG